MLQVVFQLTVEQREVSDKCELLAGDPAEL